MAPFVRLWFDRGALCLEGSLGPGLGFALWDPRTRYFRAPAHRYRDALDAAAALGLSVDDEIAPSLRAPPGAFHLPPSRPFAHDALTAFDSFGGRASVAAAPGELAQVALGAMASSRGPSLLLCPEREDVSRWDRLLRRWYDGPICAGGDEPSGVTLLTFDAAYQRMERLGGRFAMLVVDGAHRFAQGLRPDALESCAAPERLGLCGARPRAGSAGEARLRSLLGPVVCERVQVPLPPGARAARATRLCVPLDAIERRELERAYGPMREARESFARAHPGAPEQELFAALRASAEGRAALAGYQRARSLACLPQAKRSTARELLARHHDERVVLATALPAGSFAVSPEHVVSALAADLPRASRAPLLDRLSSGSIVVASSLSLLARGGAPPGTSVALLLGGASPGDGALELVSSALRPAPGSAVSAYELTTFESGEDGAWAASPAIV